MATTEEHPFQDESVSDGECARKRQISIHERCTKLIKKKKDIVLYVTSVGVLLFVVLSIISWGHQNENGKNPENGHAPRLGASHGVKNDTDHLLINQDKCSKNKCIICKANVTLEYIPYEPLSCATSNRNIKNASCYFCNNTCLTTDDIRRIGGRKGIIKCENNAPLEIDCCFVAQMANLEKHVAEGRYKCYTQSVHELYNRSVVQPLWHCQYGRKGERCQYLHTETFICKCYKYIHRFFNQDKLPRCNQETRSLRASKCHMVMDINGKQHNCLCSNATDYDNIGSCESPNTATLTTEKLSE